MLRNSLYRPWFENDTRWGIEIIDGEFKDVVLDISKLEFNETEDGNLQIEYNVLHQPVESPVLDNTNELFGSVLQLIFNDILTEAIKIFEQEREQNRTNDITPSDSQ